MDLLGIANHNLAEGGAIVFHRTVFVGQRVGRVEFTDCSGLEEGITNSSVLGLLEGTRGAQNDAVEDGQDLIVVRVEPLVVDGIATTGKDGVASIDVFEVANCRCWADANVWCDCQFSQRSYGGDEMGYSPRRLTPSSVGDPKGGRSPA